MPSVFGQAAPRSDDVEIQIARVSADAIRLTVLPLQNGAPIAVPMDGSLVHSSWGPPLVAVRSFARPQSVKSGNLRIDVAPDPLSFTIRDARGAAVQHVNLDRETGTVSFDTGNAPLLGLGEGGPQFDRRGSIDRMRSGQGGYQLRTHGGRVPIQWVIGTGGGTGGWAMFIHQPYGAFDFSGPQSKFQPADAALPLDMFIVISRDPATIMAEYARLTGHAELPALWIFGYQQSHRTLASREEILEEARTFREKRLPCDALIYLGTGFTPSGWNTNNGEFGFNQKVFPDPKVMFDQLHQDHFKVVLHVVITARSMQGFVAGSTAWAPTTGPKPSTM